MTSGRDDAEEALRARLAQLFLEELHDNLAVLDSGLTQLEHEPAGDTLEAVIPELFRAAHSLKGAAHAASVAAAVGPCGRLEDTLAELRDGRTDLNPAVLARLRADLDALAELGPPPPQRGGPGQAADEPGGVEARPPSRTGPHLASRARVEVRDLDAVLDDAGALLDASQRLTNMVSDQHRSQLVVPVGRSEPSAPGPTVHVPPTRSSAPGASTNVEAEIRRLQSSAGRIAESARRLRMQQIGDALAGLDRTVAETAQVAGKQAELVIEGEDIAIDRDIAGGLREPLLHLVRNAVDHGIETSADRLELGKPGTGRVYIRAALEEGRVRLEITDDGRGIDVQALGAAARTRDPGAEDDIELAFRHGVSTAPKVSDVSGRGVGLDAVRTRVEALGGTVRLRSHTTQPGTEAIIHLPTSLALLRVVLARTEGETVALPSAMIGRFHRLGPADLQTVEGQPRARIADRSRPARYLSAALGLGSQSHSGKVVAIELADEDTVLLVDRVEGEGEMLLKRLPPRIASPLLLGGVVLPSGAVAIVANPYACLRASARVAGPPTRSVQHRRRPTVLLVEDSPTTRALERSILLSAGHEVLDAADGVEAWQLLSEQSIDLVVTDIDMPRMGGIELCRAIRASPRLGETPVILLTSLASDEDRRRGLDAGANAYLVKSAFDQSTLLEAVRRLT